MSYRFFYELQFERDGETSSAAIYYFPFERESTRHHPLSRFNEIFAVRQSVVKLNFMLGEERKSAHIQASSASAIELAGEEN